MQKFLIICIIVIFGLNLKAQDFEFKLYSCETTSLITLKNNKLHFVNDLLEHIEHEVDLEKEDLKIINEEIKNILKKKGNEVWLNHCIDDGTNLKFKIIEGDIVLKKVFVGNYLDLRLNKIILIIDQYLKKFNTNRYIITISYGFDSEESINSKIAEQKSCPMIAPRKFKKAMLNSWCEF